MAAYVESSFVVYPLLILIQLIYISVAADEDSNVKSCDITDNQSLCHDDFVIEDFQDEAIGHWSDRCAVIDSDNDEDLTESLPTITSRPRGRNNHPPDNINPAVVASSNTLPRSEPGTRVDSGHESRSDVDNKTRQLFKFRKCQYGNTPSLDTERGSVSRPSGFSPHNCAVGYVGDVSRVSDAFVANTKDISAKPVLCKQQTIRFPSENKGYNTAIATGNRVYGSGVTGMQVTPRMSLFENSEQHSMNNDFTPAQNTKHQNGSGILPRNKSQMSESVIVEKYNPDDFADLDFEMDYPCSKSV